MRSLMKEELNAVTGTGLYWVPPQEFIVCDAYGCLTVIEPGYYQEVYTWGDFFFDVCLWTLFFALTEEDDYYYY